jgi:hypothetical protein
MSALTATKPSPIVAEHVINERDAPEPNKDTDLVEGIGYGHFTTQMLTMDWCTTARSYFTISG